MTRRPPSSILLVFGLLCCMPSGAFEPIGTIEAVIDGQARTWHVPGGQDSVSGSGAMWMSIHPGVGTAVLGGFESTDVEFGQDQGGIPTASGEGSQIVITFEFPLDATKADLRLPGKDGENFSVLLLPTVGDYAGMQGMDEGMLSASLIQARQAGASRFEGRFAGRLVDRDGRVLGRITAGSFSVDGAIFFAPE